MRDRCHRKHPNLLHARGRLVPWHIEADNAGCRGFAVVKDENGEIEGCHRTRQQAERQLAALNIAEADEEERAPGHVPNEGMIAEAERGLEWRREYNRGGTEIGVARARDIINRKALSLDTVRRMVSYFARHEVDKQGQGWSPNEDGYPSAGRIAWALWGGDAGRTWAENISNQERLATGPTAIITDIDGTLIDTNAGVNGALIRTLNNSDATVIVVTGRAAAQRDNTEALLNRIGLDYDSLIMSEGGDPTAYKRETAQRLLERYNIVKAYENNPNTIAAYRELDIDTEAPNFRRASAEAILAEIRMRY